MNNHILTKSISASIFLFFSLSAFAQKVDLIQIMEKEIKREMEGLKEAEYPPYYMDYRIDEINSLEVTASFGSLTESFKNKSRILTTNVKVGDYALDDSHQLENSSFYHPGGAYGGYNAIIPIENDPDAIQQALWRATKSEYNTAAEAYKSIKNELAKETIADSSSNTGDFSIEEPSVYIEETLPEIDELINQIEWEQKVKKISALFQENSQLISGMASISFSKERMHFISTENSKVAQNSTYAYLNISATILAEDGDLIPLYKSYFAFSPKDLPSEEILLEETVEMLKMLEELRTAPLADPYSGPAILDARSAGVFFHEIFGHRIEGHRLRSEMDGQTFLSKVNQEVLNKRISVYSDPSLAQFEKQDLIGNYKYDEEGVKGQRITIVKNGVLNSFLMSRSPLKNFPHSNGHGRASAGIKAFSRQSNLIIETSKPHSMQQLRKKLVKECKKQGKEYGYLFSDVMGGFTNTDRYSANAFNIMPTIVYRVYVDGRPDEMVRGVDLIGTPLAMFAQIEAAGDQKEVFTGICGAESGGVPVSAVAPALFVKRIETQKKAKINAQAPILSRPGTHNTPSSIK